MKSKKWKIILIGVVGVGLIAGFFLRFYFLNKDVVRDTENELFKIGEWVTLGDVNVRVLDQTKNNSSGNEAQKWFNEKNLVTYAIDLEVENAGHEAVDISTLQFQSELIVNHTVFYPTNNIDFSDESQTDIYLNPNEKKQLSLVYDYSETYLGNINKVSIHFPRILYKEEFTRVFEDNKKFLDKQVIISN